MDNPVALGQIYTELDEEGRKTADDEQRYSQLDGGGRKLANQDNMYLVPDANGGITTDHGQVYEEAQESKVAMKSAPEVRRAGPALPDRYTEEPTYEAVKTGPYYGNV